MERGKAEEPIAAINGASTANGSSVQAVFKCCLTPGQRGHVTRVKCDNQVYRHVEICPEIPVVRHMNRLQCLSVSAEIRTFLTPS